MTERRLLAWLAGALEPGEAADVAARVADDPHLDAQVRLLEARIEEGPPRQRWSVPPPGISGGQRAFGVSYQPSAFSDGPVRGGDAFRIRLEDPGAPDRLVVVLLRGAAGWAVLAPGGPDELLPLSELPRDGEGFTLDLIAPEGSGPWRWAVALPALDWEIDWTLPEPERWAGLQEAVVEGRVPVSSFEVGGARL